MIDTRKKLLTELGPESLADALLKLAEHNAIADSVVELLIATPSEKVKKIKSKLAGLKRSKSYIPWGKSHDFSLELQQLLDMLKLGTVDPATGCRLVAKFYECDQATFGRCDDSSGYIGIVFRHDAAELFSQYAQRCDDKQWVADLVFDLNKEDDYGVRDALIYCASDYLSQSVIESLIHRIQKTEELESDKYVKQNWLRLIESLANQIKNPELFLSTRTASGAPLNDSAWLDIAEVYLNSGKAGSALTHLEKIQDEDTHLTHRRDQMLLKVYEQLGESQKQEYMAWKLFRRGRTNQSLEDLLTVIGKEQRDGVLQEELPLIHANISLSLTDAIFLVDMGLMDEVARYVLARVGQLNGDHYYDLLPLAKTLEKAGHRLSASVLYRSLLDSILHRAKSTIYHHGARYLKKLDQMAPNIDNWHDVPDHQTYFQELRQNHGRKPAFWSKYDDN